ncbi:MAG: haloacid dehalogenase type II [Pseudomonadota bacterium]
MTPALLGFKVLTFDCYGTLIDWETGIWDALQPMLAENALHSVTRDAALDAYARFEKQAESDHPRDAYPVILERTHAAITEHFGGKPNPDLDSTFGASVGGWPAFADSAVALRFLKTHFRLVILSNVHREGFALSSQKLGVDFDAVYTAEDIGSYKPSPANFSYLLHHLERDFGIARHEVLHTAQSLYHDHAPANAMGLANAWINRAGARAAGSVEKGGSHTHPDTVFTFSSLRAMADAVRIESEG